jgi:hypothetical protein
MRILLISLRTRILLMFPAAATVLLGTMGFHVTAERQMRQEFVREHLQASAMTIAARRTRKDSKGGTYSWSPGFWPWRTWPRHQMHNPAVADACLTLFREGTHVFSTWTSPAFRLACKTE